MIIKIIHRKFYVSSGVKERQDRPDLICKFIKKKMVSGNFINGHRNQPRLPSGPYDPPQGQKF